jgi:hypothetical protein
MNEGVFMVTAATSIIFALLAASPVGPMRFAAHATGSGRSGGGRRAGETWSPTLERHKSLPPENRINLLIYEHRVQMSQDEHWARMQRRLRDREGIYHTMTDHLYWLGLMAERMFRLLNVSYTVFRWGLLVSVMVFVISNEIRGKDGRKESQLWLWSGHAEDPPSRLELPRIINLSNVESIDSVIVHGEPRLLLMSDEGDAKKGRPVRYVFLDYKELEY